ncbi:MAG: response regulator [Gemmatimonadota bacterium]
MKRRILVVDDDAQIRHALIRALERQQYEVISAAGGDSAYAVLSETHVDLVLLDLVMPQMSGDALFLAIIRRWPALRGRVILISGDIHSSRDQWPAELKACRVLEKPFGLAELYRAVELALIEEELPPFQQTSNA